MTNYIKIEGIGFANKGSTLMMTSVYQYLNNKKPNIVFMLGKPGFYDYKEYGGKEFLFYKEESIFRFGIHLTSVLPKKYLEYRGLLRDVDVNIILNLGGYALGDPWISSYSKEKNKELENYYKRYKKNGVKIIYLPQAYGPFELELSRDRISRISDYVDLFFVRDKASCSFLKGYVQENKIILSPDFTSVQEGILLKSDYDIAKNSIVIIPNNKMITHTDTSVGNNYLIFLIRIIEKLSKLKYKIILLNHEDKEDRKLIEVIKNEVPESVCVMDNKSALEIKGIIGVAKIVISSRFHGVINALNQGIPAFATSWSHKYKMLYDEFEISDLLLNISEKSTNMEIKKILNLLTDDKSYKQLQEKIKSHNSVNKKQTERMFSTILEYLN